MTSRWQSSRRTDPARGRRSAVIAWGDDSTTSGTVSGPDSNGVYTVTGTYDYFYPALGGTNAVTVTVSDLGGLHATANTTAYVGTAPTVPAPVFSGRLSTGSTATATNRPTFSGVTNPFGVVQLSARLVGVDATLSRALTGTGACLRGRSCTGSIR